MASLELTVPPPLVAVACAGAMKLLSQLPAGAGATPSAATLADLRLVAPLLATVGVAIAIAGLVSFRRARTTVNPHKPDKASVLVTTGIYRVTRNPMYLGIAVVLLGWTAWLGTPWALPGVAAFAAYITRFQILPEERTLAQRFGADYENYRATVRRWI